MGKLLFEAKTVQGAVFKTLIEAIKEVVADGNFEISSEGISLTAMDPSCTVLVSPKLHAEQFESYHCDHKLIIGVSMASLFKMIRTVSNNDTLCLSIDAADPNVLCIKVENADRNTVTNYWLNLMDIDVVDLTIPWSAEFDSVIVMQSADFQKICRDMHAIGEVMEIQAIGQQLKLVTTGDIGKQETILGATDALSLTNTDEDRIVQGRYNLKQLSLFTKCTNLSPQCKILLSNDFPLVVVFAIADLGDVKLVLAPTVTE